MAVTEAPRWLTGEPGKIRAFLVKKFRDPGIISVIAELTNGDELIVRMVHKPRTSLTTLPNWPTESTTGGLYRMKFNPDEQGDIGRGLFLGSRYLWDIVSSGDSPEQEE